MKLFVAGSSKDRHWIHLLIKTLQGQGHRVHDWTRHPGWLAKPGSLAPRAVAEENMLEVDSCDGLIWVVSQTSEGAAWEASRADAQGKPVVVLWVGETSWLKFMTHVYTSLYPLVSTLDDAVLKLEEFHARNDSS